MAPTYSQIPRLSLPVGISSRCKRGEWIWRALTVGAGSAGPSRLTASAEFGRRSARAQFGVDALLPVPKGTRPYALPVVKKASAKIYEEREKKKHRPERGKLACDRLVTDPPSALAFPRRHSGHSTTRRTPFIPDIQDASSACPSLRCWWFLKKRSEDGCTFPVLLSHP